MGLHLRVVGKAARVLSPAAQGKQKLVPDAEGAKRDSTTTSEPKKSIWPQSHRAHREKINELDSEHSTPSR
jgi:hypothetical protein